MTSTPLPYLPHPTTPKGKANVDRPGGTAGQSYTAYGLRFGLRSNHPAGMAQAAPYAPLGWQVAPTGGTGTVDILYSLRLAHSTSSGQAPASERQGRRNYHLLYCGSALLARSLELPPSVPKQAKGQRRHPSHKAGQRNSPDRGPLRS